MKVLCVIPARGGSKGIPKKNIVDINGKPLIEWSILQAKESGCVDYIHISTDSPEIAEVSKKAGAECAFLRPDNISGDKIGTGAAIYSSIKGLSELGYEFDIVLELQPTYCLRGSKMIAECVSLLKENNKFHSVITCKKIDSTEHPDYALEKSNNGFTKFGLKKPDEFVRQNLRPVYACHGLVLAAKVDNFLEKQSFFIENCHSYIVDDVNRLMDINTGEDLLFVRMFTSVYPEYLS
jgi:CMP-N,N'-diacetyllegionaminic acid synthase